MSHLWGRRCLFGPGCGSNRGFLLAERQALFSLAELTIHLLDQPGSHQPSLRAQVRHASERLVAGWGQVYKPKNQPNAEYLAEFTVSPFGF